MIRGTTRICGLMGDPVEHTRSPQMHNFFSEKTGQDLCYVPFHVKPEHLKEAVEGALALGICGLNVTVPHKQAVMAHLADIDRGAQIIGAVNTLVRTEGGFKGYNTDAFGLSRALKEAHMEIAGRVCILLGAGGAAKAAAYVLAEEGAKKVYVLNRTLDKALKLAEHMNQAFGREILIPLALEEWRRIPEDSCLAVQTTSAGMYPHVEEAPVEEEAFFHKLSAAFDVIYTPEETRFLKLAREAGAQVSNGLDMLIYQGIAAYELWTPAVTITREMAEEAKGIITGGKQA